MTSTTTLRAWIDESGSIHALDPGTYLLAAAIGPHDAEDEARRVMQRLRLRGQKKLHWRDENPRRQRAITAAVATLTHTHLVVVRTGDTSDTPSRRRNKCPERLLPELETRGVTDATFGPYGLAEDRLDLPINTRPQPRDKTLQIGV